MANEGRRPNVDGEAIKDAISNFIMLWSDTRPDNRIDLNQDPEVKQVLREIDPEGKFSPLPFMMVDPLAETRRPEKAAAMSAMNDLLAMTTLTTGCRGAHLTAASTDYDLGMSPSGILQSRELTYDDGHPGPYDPANAYAHEARFLDFEFVVAGSIILPDLRSEHFQMAVRWEAQFREKYMDESFKALADRVSETE